jgi:DNA-binding NarL/FixJ family response regulator
VDHSFSPLYVSECSLRILTYPNFEPEVGGNVQRRLRSILGAEEYADDLSPAVSFLSGRRLYLCRSILLRYCLETSGAPKVAFVLERQYSGWSTALCDASKRFNLSQRETETVQLLVYGLTTKEIASRMNVSPNTIKQFVRFVMSKMGVSTRAGVLGKIVPR